MRLHLPFAGAYKTHLLSLNVDLGPHDAVPDALDKFVNVEYTMNNSTVSHAQVRSVSLASGSSADEPPDRWVRHSARYEHTVEIEFTDRVRCKPDTAAAAYDGDDAAGGVGAVPRRSSRAASTERSALGGGLGPGGGPADRSASAPPITADDSSDDSPPTDDSD